jgi:small subunit ribosomal protein S16
VAGFGAVAHEGEKVLKIRLRRMGAKHAAFYRIVVSDSRSTPRGRFVESVGTYDPGTDPATVRLDVARTEDWISKGAHPSDTVRRLLVRAKAVEASGGA